MCRMLQALCTFTFLHAFVLSITEVRDVLRKVSMSHFGKLLVSLDVLP